MKEEGPEELRAPTASSTPRRTWTFAGLFLARAGIRLILLCTSVHGILINPACPVRKRRPAFLNFDAQVEVGMKSGIQDLYEEPIEPDLTIDTSESVPEACVGELVSGLEAWKATEAMTLQLVRTAPGSRPRRGAAAASVSRSMGSTPPRVPALASLTRAQSRIASAPEGLPLSKGKHPPSSSRPSSCQPRRAHPGASLPRQQLSSANQEGMDGAGASGGAPTAS